MKTQNQQADRESRSNANQVSSKGLVQYASVVQRAAEKHVAIAIVKQAKRNWCWASVCEAFTGKSQVTLANTYTSGYAPNGPGKYEDPYTVLTAEGKNVAVTATDTPVWGTIVGHLDSDETPVCKVGSHYVIICGYKGNGGLASDRRYFYKDPADGNNEQEATEAELKNMNGGFEGYYIVT